MASLSCRACCRAVRVAKSSTTCAERPSCPWSALVELAGVLSIETGADDALRMVVNHLVVHHMRRKVVLIEGPAGNPDSIERSQIVRSVLSTLNVPLDDSHVVAGDFLEASGATAIRILLDRRGVALNEIDAVIASNDQMAVGAIYELTSRGIRVPQDVSVVGFDDDEFARSANPPLTTISQPLELIGERAIHLILARMRGEHVDQRIILEADPVWRRSCGCEAPGVLRLVSIAPPEACQIAVESCRRDCFKRYERLAGLLADARAIETVLATVCADTNLDLAPNLRELESDILRAFKHGIDPLRWHDVLSPVSTTVERRAVADGEVGRLRERRMRIITLHINEVAARVRALEHLHTMQWAHASRVLASALLSVRHVRSLSSVLNAGLPSLGIRYCCVCLFVGDGEPREARVAALYSPSLPPPVESPRSAEQLWLAVPGSVPPDQPQNIPVTSVFPALELVHPRLRNSTADALDLSVYPLVYAHATLGYVVFDAPADAHQSWLLEGLAGSLSSAVYAMQRNAEIRDARDKAERANAAKTEFVAMISHEVRTPLTAIIGHLDLCLQTQLTDEQAHHVQQAKTSSRSLIGIVNDILDFSKIEAQKIELESVPFSLDEVLDQVVATCAQSATRKGLRLVVDVNPDIPHWLRGDALRLGQVLLNLVGNAVKFSSHGAVCVTVRSVPDSPPGELCLHFCVEDDGIGMRPEEIARIFDPFTQGDGSMTRKYGGTGLGLTISRRLVNLMKGDISVTSESGRGSKFEFAACFKPCELPNEDLVRGAGKHVLVVEANMLLQQALQHLLRSYGFEAVCVSSLQAGLEMLQQAEASDADFDLVVCDHDPTDCHALRFISHASSLLETAGSAVLLLTSADAEFHDDELSQVPNLVAVIQQPFQRRHLTQVIARALSVPRSHGPASQGRYPSFRVPGGTRILVVQDDPTTCDVLCEILSKAGAQVCVATTGNDAIDSVKEQSFDLIFQDIHLPDIDGYTTAQAIRATSNGAKIPILALSASSQQNNLAKCLASGINDFLPAPVEAQGLIRMVRLWVGGESPAPLSTRHFQPVTFSGYPNDVISQAPQSSGHELDVAAALYRLGGDQALYARLLRRFAKSNEATTHSLRQMLERGEEQSAILLSHTLASAAANIGAVWLSQVAQAIEADLRLGEVAGAAERLTDLEMAESRTLQAVRRHLATETSLEKSLLEPAASDLPQVAQRLRAHIDDHDSAALDDLAQLRNTVGARTAAGDAFQRLEASVAAYDFEQARIYLDTLMDAMPSVGSQRS